MIKTLAMTALLAFAPVAALACSAHEQAAISCADGMSYDAASHSCKAVSG